MARNLSFPRKRAAVASLACWRESRTWIPDQVGDDIEEASMHYALLYPPANIFFKRDNIGCMPSRRENGMSE